MTNARDGTVPATLATQRIALRVAPRKRRAVERQRRREQAQATGRLAFDEARGVVALEVRRRVWRAVAPGASMRRSRATCGGPSRRWPCRTTLATVWEDRAGLLDVATWRQAPEA